MGFTTLSNHVSKEIVDAFKIVWDYLGRPGAWWTGTQRIAIAQQVRNSAPRPLWDRPPPLDTLSDEANGVLTFFELGVVERVTVQPSSINLETYEHIVQRMGQDKYLSLIHI